MKKKLIALATTAMLVLSMGTMAFAADSPTAGNASNIAANTSQQVQVDEVQTRSAAEYLADFKGATATMGGQAVEIIVSAVSDNTVSASVSEVKAQLRDVAKLAELLKSDSLKAAFSDPTKKIVPTIKTLVDVTVKGRTVTADDPVTVTFQVPGVKAGANILVLHWNGTQWETIVPDSVKDGEVTATFTSLSPVAIVELDVQDATTAASNTATNTTNTTNVTSPKTGMSASAVIPALALVFAAGAVVCARRAKNN